MAEVTRRDLLNLTGAAAAGAALGDGLAAHPAAAQASPAAPASQASQAWTVEPEKGASLRIRRPSKFVQGAEATKRAARYYKST